MASSDLPLTAEQLAAIIAADPDGAVRRAIVRLIEPDVEAIARYVTRRALDLRDMDGEGVHDGGI